MIFPRQVRSGSIAKISCAPPKATRKPVITSSKISKLPVRSVMVAQALEIPRRRQHATHVAGNRLDDDAGNLAGVRGEGGFAAAQDR